MARSKKRPSTPQEPTCDCAKRRTQWAGVPRLIDAPDSRTFACREMGSEVFCRCRVCGSRWRVTITTEYDGGSAETLYAWEESPWTEELLQARQFEGLHEAQQERERREREEYWRQRNPNSGREMPASGDRAPHVPSQQQPGPLEWRWTDESGTSHGCRIEGSLLNVWTENPFGGSGTSYSLSEFLEGRHGKALPAGIAGRVREAARRES